MTATAAPAAPAAPTRPALNPEVLDTPALAMPQYAGYDTKFVLVDGIYLLCGDRDWDTFLDVATRWATATARILRTPLAPHPDAHYGHRAVGTAPTSGGTWGGRCGAVRWVPDHDFYYRDAARTVSVLATGGVGGMIQHRTNFAWDYVGTTQAWWVNGIAARRSPSTDGFFVECEQAMRHDGPCIALDLTWDWRDYAPCHLT